MLLNKVSHWIGLSMVLFLGACQPTNDPIQNKSDRCESAEDLVKQIYRDNLKLNTLNVAKVEHYFESNMAQRLNDEIRCQKSQKVCNIDFDIFTDTQDPPISIHPKLLFDEKAHTVQADFKIGNEAKIIKYEMSEEGCPKIKNIIYTGDYDLDMLLSNPTEQDMHAAAADDDDIEISNDASMATVE